MRRYMIGCAAAALLMAILSCEPGAGGPIIKVFKIAPSSACYRNTETIITTWETDANSVTFVVYDEAGQEAFRSEPQAPSDNVGIPLNAAQNNLAPGFYTVRLEAERDGITTQSDKLPFVLADEDGTEYPVLLGYTCGEGTDATECASWSVQYEFDASWFGEDVTVIQAGLRSVSMNTSNIQTWSIQMDHPPVAGLGLCTNEAECAQMPLIKKVSDEWSQNPSGIVFTTGLVTPNMLKGHIVMPTVSFVIACK
jgi:hypothetical protein